MKNKLYETKALVKQVLEENERTRNSDNELYVEICYRVNPSVMRLPFEDVIGNLASFGLPPFESVRRSRQKLQEERPDLRPCDEVALFRAENEMFYEEFVTK
jgi:hypothetical protein